MMQLKELSLSQTTVAVQLRYVDERPIPVEDKHSIMLLSHVAGVKMHYVYHAALIPCLMTCPWVAEPVRVAEFPFWDNLGGRW